MTHRTLVAALLAACMFNAQAQHLMLAPGKSVTILDAADPSVRLVITAPPDALLNLSDLLTTDPKDSIHSMATRMQMRQARGMTLNPDGSVSLSAPIAAATEPGQAASALQGGVLVFNAGRYVLYPAASSPAPQVSEPAAAAAGAPYLAKPPSVTISKPGATKEQTERDIRQCEVYAQNASLAFLRAADRASMYNSAMRSCLQGFGYQIHAPAA